MIRSIRTFLLVNLLASVTLVTLLTIFCSFFLSYKDSVRLTDAELEAFAQGIQQVKCLTYPSKANPSLALTLLSNKNDEKNNNKHQIFQGKLQFEVLDKNGKPILQSGKFYLNNLRKDGFGQEIINGEVWEIYSTKNKETGNRILVGESYSPMRAAQIKIIKNLILIFFITYPILSLLIWLIVTKGLNSIQRVTKEVRKRAANRLTAIDMKIVPNEIKPMALELNNLFAKLEAAFQREKRFAADAAHELKTPLAALKTQSQVALNATQEDERQKALNNIISCVDRGTHTIQQLLILSRMLPEVTLRTDTIDLNKSAAGIITDLYNIAKKKNINIELITPGKPQLIVGNNAGIDILLKNIIDNAIRYIPENGAVQIIVEDHNKYIIFKVIDNGPGIPQELRDRVFERFYRILGNKSPGSGLGLSIVKQIAQIHKAQVELTTPLSGKGLEVRIIFLKRSMR